MSNLSSLSKTACHPKEWLDCNLTSILSSCLRYVTLSRKQSSHKRQNVRITIPQDSAVKWKEFKSHEIISHEEVQTEASNLIRPKKQVSLKIFCETCSELICIDCTIKLHQGHNYDLVADTFSKHKDEI